MTVRIIREESQEESVALDLVINTLEKNRDRIRTIGGMLLTISGLLISTCLGFLLFTVDRKLFDKTVAGCFLAAMVIFLTSSCLSILASFLRTNYSISTKGQFVTDLLSLYYSELGFSRWSFLLLVIGLSAMIIGGLIFVIRHWG